MMDISTDRYVVLTKEPYGGIPSAPIKTFETDAQARSWARRYYGTKPVAWRVFRTQVYAQSRTYTVLSEGAYGGTALTLATFTAPIPALHDGVRRFVFQQPRAIGVVAEEPPPPPPDPAQGELEAIFSESPPPSMFAPPLDAIDEVPAPPPRPASPAPPAYFAPTPRRPIPKRGLMRSRPSCENLLALVTEDEH